MRFRDRVEAGLALAKALNKYQRTKAVVLALPRGGVVLGAEVARSLSLSLDLVIPRKIGHPVNPEYAVCAVSEHGDLICNESERRSLDPDWLKQQVSQELDEAIRRRGAYLGKLKAPSLIRKTAIIVDDGIATGLTMRAAIKDARRRGAKRVVVAVPVVPADTAELLKSEADELVALAVPALYLGAVGAYYDRFEQVEDTEVIRIIKSFGS